MIRTVTFRTIRRYPLLVPYGLNETNLTFFVNESGGDFTTVWTLQILIDPVTLDPASTSRVSSTSSQEFRAVALHDFIQMGGLIRHSILAPGPMGLSIQWPLSQVAKS